VGIAYEVGRAEANTPAPKASGTTTYTGIIVDTQGLGFKPALFPRLLDDNGAVLYDLHRVNANATLEHGLCGYKQSLGGCLRNNPSGSSVQSCPRERYQAIISPSL